MTNPPDIGSETSKERFRISWTHPVTLIVLTTLVSAAGWFVNRVVTRRDAVRAENMRAQKQTALAAESRSDLRMQVEDLSQAIPLIAKSPPVFSGEPVFCDTARMTLIVAHNGKGSVPVLVNDIAVKVESVAPSVPEKIDCAVDTLASKPFGIVERDLYIIDVAGNRVSGQYIRSKKPGEAFPINPQNILQTTRAQQAISLKPAEEPTGYSVSVVAASPGLYRVWFTADYDTSGPKTAKTESFLIAK
jgi:hypothetical protein